MLVRGFESHPRRSDREQPAWFIRKLRARELRPQQAADRPDSRNRQAKPNINSRSDDRTGAAPRLGRTARYQRWAVFQPRPLLGDPKGPGLFQVHVGHSQADGADAASATRAGA